MGKRLCRITLLAALVAACALLLGGCLMMDLIDSESYDGYTSFTDSRESISEGYFKMTIHTDKDTFAQGETIDCWTEIEYIGEEDSITVYVYGNPVEMDMTGESVYYSSSGYYDVGDTLTLYKGVPVRFTLAECLPKSSSVLPGQYEIDAWATLGLSPDGGVSYNGYVSAVIVVEKDEG